MFRIKETSGLRVNFSIVSNEYVDQNLQRIPAIKPARAWSNWVKKIHWKHTHDPEVGRLAHALLKAVRALLTTISTRTEVKTEAFVTCGDIFSVGSGELHLDQARPLLISWEIPLSPAGTRPPARLTVTKQLWEQVPAKPFTRVIRSVPLPEVSGTLVQHQKGLLGFWWNEVNATFLDQEPRLERQRLLQGRSGQMR